MNPKQKLFDAADGSGEVTYVPAGTDRTLAIEGLDAGNAVTYQGGKTGITVLPDIVNDAGTVTMVVAGTAPGPVSSFGASPQDATSVYLSWLNPSDSDFSAVRILRRSDQYPAAVDDGTEVFDGSATIFVDTGLTEFTTYYYTAYARNLFGVYSTGQNISGTPITGGNNVPTATGADLATNEDTALPITLQGSDLDSGDTLTYTITSQPTYGTISSGSSASRTYTPVGDYNGSDSFQFRVSDGTALSSTATVNITVNGVADNPVISGTPVTSVNQDVAYSFTPTFSDPDTPYGDTLALSIANKPSWAAFSTSTGALTGTPGNSDVGTYSNVTISVTDGGGLGTKVDLTPFTISVNDVNEQPTISGTPTTSVNQDVPYSFTPTSSDPDLINGDVLLFSIQNKPSWATLNTSTGALTGTPGNAHVGTYPNIIITVTDLNGAGLSANLAAFTITVNNVNDAPVASAGPDATYNGGETATLDGSASTDPDLSYGDRIRYTWTQTGGTLTGIKLDNPYVAQPHIAIPNTAGTATFSLQVIDANGLTNSDSVTITTLAYAGSALPGISAHPFQVQGDTGFATSMVSILNFVYETQGNSFKIIDVTDKANPVPRGSYDTGAGANAVAIRGTLAYVANSSQGLTIIDISDPDAPALVATIDTPGSAVDVFVPTGNYAYVADQTSMQVIDISTPATPSIVGSYAAVSQITDVVVVGTTAYLGDNTNGLVMVDVSTPSSPTFISKYQTIGGVADVVVSQGYAYIAMSEHGLDIVDVSTPASPTRTKLLSSPSASEVKLVGTHVFLAAYTSGMASIDVSNKANAFLDGVYRTIAPVYAIAVGIAGAETWAYASTQTSGLLLLNVTSPTTGIWGYASTPYASVQVAASGQQVYAAEATSGFRVYDVSNPTAPTSIASSTAIDAWAVQADRDRAYFAYQGPGDNFHIYDTTTPSSPSKTGGLMVGGITSQMARRGNELWIPENLGGYTYQLNVVNAANPASPTLAGSYSADSGWTVAGAIAVEDNLAYLASAQSPAGVELLDATSASLLSFVSATTAGQVIAPNQMQVRNGILYVADSFRLVVLDFASNPLSPAVLATVNNSSTLNAVNLAGNDAYLSISANWVNKLDVSDPSAPRVSGLFGIGGGTSRDLAVVGRYAYVGTESISPGLVVLEVEPTLSARYSTGATSAVLSYTVGWTDMTVAQDVDVICDVTGGSCAVSNLNQTSNTATVEWTLPGTTGDEELRITVGNQHYFTSVFDRVTVQ